MGKGLNEKTNGLLRQYFLKGIDLTRDTQEQVKWAAGRINHRPKKMFGLKSPYEVFLGGEKMLHQNTISCCTSTLNLRSLSITALYL